MKLTVSQYAKRVGVSRMTVYRWIINKALPKDVRAKVFLTRIYIETK